MGAPISSVASPSAGSSGKGSGGGKTSQGFYGPNNPNQQRFYGRQNMLGQADQYQNNYVSPWMTGGQQYPIQQNYQSQAQNSQFAAPPNAQPTQVSQPASIGKGSSSGKGF